MSGQATGWVLRYGPRDRAMRAVLLPIADSANRDGKDSHPGLAAIIEGSLYSRTQVFKILDRLQEAGWIVITEPGGGRGKATTYDIPGVIDAPLGYVENSPVSGPFTQQTVHSTQTNGALVTRNGPLPPPPTSPSATPTVTTVNPYKEHVSRDARAPDPAPLELTLEGSDDAASFAAFWDAWPRRNGRKLSKGQAHQKWRGLTRAERTAALTGARHYADASERGKAGAMDAFRWLEKKLWPDWQTPLPPDSPPVRPTPPPAGRQQIATDRTVSGRWTPATATR